VAIVDEHPAAQGPASYFAAEQPSLTQDYALIALVPAFRPNRRALILAGTTTYGTQAAAEFVCEEQSLATLLSRLDAGKLSEVPDFEALLSVQIEDKFPVASKLLSVRVHKSN
jgi:hypothetical protein